MNVLCAAAAWRAWGAWVVLALVLHLAWEVAQLPFYAVWYEGTPLFIAWAVAHCTAGDVLIAFSTYALAAALTRTAYWPWRFPLRGLAVLWVSGVAWTAFSELRHVYELGSWGYAEHMPTVAGVGLAPLLQWLVVPALALWCLREGHPSGLPWSRG